VLAKELGPRNIRVNSINPGMIETEGVHAAGFIGSDFQKMVEAQSPLGRDAPLDIAATASENPSAGWKPKERGEDGRRKRRLRFLRSTWLPGSSSSGTAQSTESTPHDYKLWSHHHDVR
jgi:hypothetical protein